MTSVTIGNSVTDIYLGAFYGCKSLTSVIIPKSVTLIGITTFNDCRNLNSIIVEDGNPKYDSRDNCNAIIETATNTLIAGCNNSTIPNSVTAIAAWAFAYCKGLTGELTIPDSVTFIDRSAFDHCSGLTRVNLSNSLTIIGMDAFSECTGLEGELTIPDSVTSIGQSAFYYCSGLTSLVIPNSVNLIKQAFMHCKGLANIYNYINHPTDVELDSYTFYGVDKSNCTLHVIKGRLDEYSEADQWKDFLNIIDDLEAPVSPGDVDGNGAVNVSDVTGLVNMILGLTDKDETVADVNGDGQVNVSDVTALVNIILGIS